MSEIPYPLPVFHIKSEQTNSTSAAPPNEIPKQRNASKPVVLADLNFVPPDNEDEILPTEIVPDVSSRLLNDENSQDRSSSLASKESDAIEGEAKQQLNKSGKNRGRSNNKGESLIDNGVEPDSEQQGAPVSREEKVSSLKTGLVHVARKMPKNAHAHFMLGLMYQRLGQPQKAVPAYEKAAEILLRCEQEIDRPEFLALVQIHHAQCLLLGNFGDYGADKELESEELDEVLSRLKESMQRDLRQAAVWNTLGYILLRTGRVENAISVLSTLLTIHPDNLDCLGNLGMAYLQSGNLELSEKCFQSLILKDQNHPAASINYAALLLCKYGSVVTGAGASADEVSSADRIVAANVAKECLLASLKGDPKVAHTWANLGNAYYMAGDIKSSSKCLEKAAKLEPSCMATRYAVSVHRTREAERSQDLNEQLSWAGNEMASILREGDSAMVEANIAWAGLAMVHKAQHEVAAAFETEHDELMEVKEHAEFCLKQAAVENPDDAVQWHQLGLHSLCTQQFGKSQKYLKSAVGRFKDCCYAWSNLGISTQFSEEPSQAEKVYKQALSLASSNQAHAIFSNLGNLYRQQRRYNCAKAMLTKSLELRPGYAPAYNNLGLVFVAEGQWEEAKYCFSKAFQFDPLLDAAKSNLVKAEAISGDIQACPLAYCEISLETSL